MIRERAFAKVNLVLHVGRRRADGLHELASLFAAVELADELTAAPADAPADRVICPGVEGENLCQCALAAFRSAAGVDLPALELRIDKRIPVAAGLGGGSADAAAALRAANRLAGDALDPETLRAIAARVGADVPSQIDPRHALVAGAGELVEPVDLPDMALVLIPQAQGLSTADVYRAADRLGTSRARVDHEQLRAIARAPLGRLAAAVENDLEPAALSLRPELRSPLAALRGAGALAAAVTGSGPTVFGVFRDEGAASRAAASLRAPAIVTGLLRKGTASHT